MTIMQENGDAVNFSPEFITRNPPLPEKLLGFYLLAIVIVLLVRVIQLIRCLWELRRNRPIALDGWEKVWTLGRLRAHSLMRLGTLTFFLCILEMSLGLTNELWVVGTQNAAPTRWLLVEIAEGLDTFSAGMVVCVVLYACGFLFESRLERRRLAVNTAPAPSQASTD